MLMQTPFQLSSPGASVWGWIPPPLGGDHGDVEVGAGPGFSWPALCLAGLLPPAGLAFVSAAPVLGGMLAASLVLLLGWALVAAVLTVRLSEPADSPAAVVVDSRRGTR